MIAAPTFSQIKAQVTAILQRSSGKNGQAIGIYAPGRWTGDRQQYDGAQCYLIDQCDSPLALRIALQNGQQERASNTKLKDAIHVLITPIPESDLAEDILIRLVKQRLFTIDAWQIVKALFRATNIDPRLMQHPWLPRVLVDWTPANRYAPVMGGFLDAEIVWPLLLKHGLNLQAERPDLASILQWSTDLDHVERYQQAPEEFQTAASGWLASQAGVTAETILHCVGHTHRPDALPLGLAAAVIYHPDAALEKAIGKFEERFLGGRALPSHTPQIWSDAAQQALKSLPTEQQQILIRRSDVLLEDLGAIAFAHLSPVSEQGFEQHLTDFSKQLVAHLQQPTQAALSALHGAYESLQRHQQIIYAARRRRQRLDMSIRLAQWLLAEVDQPTAVPESLEAAISRHAQDSSFLDWARLMLPIAEPHRALSTAYGQLFDRVTAIREQRSLQFAKLLQNWTATGSTRKSVLTVEDILETVVAPIAEAHRVLLIVMDGMSLAVAHELLSDLTQQHWQLIAPNAQTLPVRGALAALPSETSTSRTSLLCGQLMQGKQNTEKKCFVKHAALLQHCKRSAPPVLFHKDALQSVSPPRLSGELYDALGSEKHQVVGLVLNAVDDLLSKGDQVDIEWSCDRIKVLQPILQAASSVNRIVILTSDHGHILHHSTQYQAAKGGERWRADDGKPSDLELQIAGERVLTSSSSTMIASWSEKLRYCTTKKHGYHGGISPQEAIVPVAVLTSSGLTPSNWHKQDISPPTWWDIGVLSPSEQQEPTQEITQNQPYVDFGPLFSHAAATAGSV